jgi:hypothetical protein
LVRRQRFGIGLHPVDEVVLLGVMSDQCDALAGFHALSFSCGAQRTAADAGAAALTFSLGGRWEQSGGHCHWRVNTWASGEEYGDQRE